MRAYSYNESDKAIFFTTFVEKWGYGRLYAIKYFLNVAILGVTLLKNLQFWNA
jgi:hypothetical protein